jgi:hypothetical protein
MLLACVQAWLMSGSLIIDILDFIIIFTGLLLHIDSLLHNHISRITGAFDHPNDYYGLVSFVFCDKMRITID